jgi:hypothetical protein
MDSKDNKLYEQARARVQRKNIEKGTSIADKDIIIDQEREIKYYREKIQRLTNTKTKFFNKELEVTIKGEDYLIQYNSDTDVVTLMVYVNKLIIETDLNRIYKNEEFRIYNKTRMKQLEDECYY